MLFSLIDFLELLNYSDVYSDSDEDTFEASYKINDYLLVRFNLKKTTKYYIGVVQSVNCDSIHVKFLRKQRDATATKGNTNYFVFPLVEDVAEIGKEDIEMTLPAPRIDKRNHYFFNIDLEKFLMHLY